MTEQRDYFDVSKEPNLFEGSFAPDAKERVVPALDGCQDEISTVRDSVANEPAFTGRLEQSQLGQWLEQKRAGCSLAGNLCVTFLAALAAGPFAVIGVFLSGSQTKLQIVYMVLFAPVIEELLKQSGMIYLLEKKPYRVFSAWQFLLAAVISSLLFSAVENAIYVYVYTLPTQLADSGAAVTLRPLADPHAFAMYRWTVCTLVHVMCSVIASIGLINVWQRQLADGRAADLDFAFKYFAIAMGLHGFYNLATVVINPQF